jgi:P27 family predicted phage terminase small subunit
MPSGRKPTPTALKLVKGNPGKRPLNSREAKVKLSRPAMPPFLCDDAKAEWDRIVDTLYTAGLLTALDAAALAAYCAAYGRWAQAERALRQAEQDENGGLVTRTATGNVIQNTLVGIANKAANDMVRFACEFGMTPSARSKVIAGDPDALPDPSAEFFG